MSHIFLRKLASCALLAAVVGCDDPIAKAPSDYTTRSVEDGLFFVSTDGARDAQSALLLDVSSDAPKLRELALPRGQTTVQQRPNSGGREVVVLTQGVAAVLTGKDKRAAVPSHVLVFDRSGQRADIVLGGRYAKFQLSEDGRYGIAFGDTAGLSLENAIEVIDLAAQTSKPVELDLDGRTPTGFVFAPEGSFPRKLAIAPLANALQIVDLEAPERGAISISFDPSSALSPQQLVFAGERIFVRSQGSPEIVTLQYVAVPAGQHPFQLAPQVLHANDVVRDIAVIGSGDRQRLLALAGSLEVFDPNIGPTAQIEGVSSFGKILQFTGTSPFHSQVLPRAMLYAEQSTSRSNQVGFIDLGNESEWGTRNVELVELGDAITALTPLADGKSALARHSTSRASVIDLEERTVQRVLLNGYEAGLLLDETSARSQLWARGSSGQLGVIDLDTFQRTELPFAVGPLYTEEAENSVQPFANNLLVVPSPTRRRIAVLQAARAGHVTFVNADGPSVQTALDVPGVFLPDLLD